MKMKNNSLKKNINLHHYVLNNQYYSHFALHFLYLLKNYYHNLLKYYSNHFD